MNLKLTLFILFSSICRLAYAQTIIIEGVVTAAQNHQAVPFATLGIEGKNIGTIADENGVFKFPIDARLADESLIISSVGYSPVSIIVRKFKQGKQQISLNPSAKTLNTVVIKPDKFKTKIFGRTGSSTIMTASMFNKQDSVFDNLGKEQAAILSIDKHCYLRDFNMLIAFNRYQSIKFRLNFYSVKDGQPDKLIVDKDILFDVTSRSGWQKVDLTPYNIYLDGYKEIAVAIQWVQSVKIDTVRRSSFGVSVTPVPFHSMYFRKKSEADWKKFSTAYVAYNITADSFKPKKNNNADVEVQPDASAVSSDSIRNYTAWSGFAQEAAASGYGRNSNTGKYLHLPDANLYYEIYGSGQPLLLLHGNGVSISSFYKQIPELAKHYEVIAVDTRAQGKSTDASIAPLTYDKFALDMQQLLDSMHIKQANVLGWSDGGNTGLIMAAKYPSYVNKLIVMGAVLSPDGIEHEQLNQFNVSLDRMKQREGNKVSNSRRLLDLLVNEPHISDSALESIKAPVLVIAGEKDVVKLEHTKKIAENIKHSKLLIVKDATHYVPQEKAEEFNQAVLNFLKE